MDEWIKHILRTVNQDRARSDIISSLKEYEVLLERDWAMKFIPMLYREPQSKWFGKRGLNWHISVGTYKENDQLTSVTVVHVFDAAAQDARTSNAILKHTLSKLHELNPALTKAFVRSDNAGCFHGSESICSVPVINQFSKVKIEQIDFADPQGGKSICDRRAAHIKSSVRKYVNEGHNVRTAAEFMTAVSGCKLKSISVVVALPPPASKMSSATIPKITTLNNFKFNDKHMKVFRQYEIGKGKKCSYQPFPCADLTIIDSFDRKNTTVFANMTGNIGNDGQEISQGITCTSDDNIDTDVSGGDHDSETSLFTCPDPNCISCFSKYGNLLKHLDIGTHRMKIQKSSLADKSKIQFALQMDNKVVSQPFARAETSNGLCTILKTGWAHKTRRPSKPFSPEQTEFLKEKFGKGEATGCKSDPEEVATVMRSVRTETGARRFSKKEFLTANQIAGFFSRLSVEKRKKFIASYEDEDLEAEIEADCVQELGKLAANCR